MGFEGKIPHIRKNSFYCRCGSHCSHVFYFQRFGSDQLLEMYKYKQHVNMKGYFIQCVSLFWQVENAISYTILPTQRDGLNKKPNEW